jgi:hypothetical protein
MPLSFFQALKELIRVFPYFAGSAVVWVVALVGGIRLCVMARRRAAIWSAADPRMPGPVPNRRLEWLAAAGPIAYLATAVIATLVARARLLGVFRGGETAARVTAVSDALGGLLNPLMFAIEASLPLVLLAAYTIALHAWARHTAGGAGPSRRRYLSAALALVVLGLAPLGAGIAGYCAELIKLTAGVTGVDQELKALMLTKGMQETRAHLDKTMVVAVCGLLGVVLSVGGAWLRAEERPDAREDRSAAKLAATLFGTALVLFAATVPLRAENHLAWPPPSQDAALNVGKLEASALVGPDPVPWAPVLFVEKDGLLVEGSPASADRAYEVLSILRGNCALLHPDEQFPGSLGIVCPAELPAIALEQALAVAALAGYLRPSLILARPGVVDRPLLGQLPRPQLSAAAMELPSDGQPGAIGVGSTGSCGAFAARVVALRRAGAAVRLEAFPAGRQARILR